MPGRYAPARKLTGQSAVLSRCDQCRGGSYWRWRVTWAASWGAEGDVELGEHVHQVGLHGPPRDVLPLADLRVGQA